MQEKSRLSLAPSISKRNKKRRPIMADVLDCTFAPVGVLFRGALGAASVVQTRLLEHLGGLRPRPPSLPATSVPPPPPAYIVQVGRRRDCDRLGTSVGCPLLQGAPGGHRHTLRTSTAASAHRRPLPSRRPAGRPSAFRKGCPPHLNNEGTAAACIQHGAGTEKLVGTQFQKP